MRERRLLFNDRMVRAILQDRKTQTRRPVLDRAGEPPPQDACFSRMHWKAPAACFDVKGFPRRWHWSARLPAAPGDVLIGRECWIELRREHYDNPSAPKSEISTRYGAPRCNGVAYRADTTPDGDEIRRYYGYKWRPSIHMPRWAARIVRSITGVRVERLQDISEADAVAEGFGHASTRHAGTDARHEFACAWDDIYVNRGLGWSVNPWVFVIEFYRPSDAADAQKGNPS